MRREQQLRVRAKGGLTLSKKKPFSGGARSGGRAADY
jgi:hypothetical protein